MSLDCKYAVKGFWSFSFRHLLYDTNLCSGVLNLAKQWSRQQLTGFWLLLHDRKQKAECSRTNYWCWYWLCFIYSKIKSNYYLLWVNLVELNSFITSLGIRRTIDIMLGAGGAQANFLQHFLNCNDRYI